MIIKYTSRIPTEQLIILDNADLSNPGSSYKVYHGGMLPEFDPTSLTHIGTIYRKPEGLYFEPNPDIVGSHQVKNPNGQGRGNLEGKVDDDNATRSIMTIDVFDKQQNPLALIELKE